MGRFRAIDRGVNDRVGDVQVLVGGPLMEAAHVLLARPEEARRAGKARQEAGHVIRRAAQESVRLVGPALVGLAPGDQVVATPWNLETPVDGSTVER
jgi:hypothetical protein